MASTDTTRTAATDAAYLASQALADLATVIGRDLLPVPIGIAPPAHGFELEVHVRHEDVDAWLGSIGQWGDGQADLLRGGALSHRRRGVLVNTQTRVELLWIEEARS